MEANVVELRGRVNEYEPAKLPTGVKEIVAMFELTTSLVLPSQKTLRYCWRTRMH
jgi:hypothetical protein